MYDVCPRVARLLFYMYTNQLYYVKWDKEKSEKCNVSNGVNKVECYHLFCSVSILIIYLTD